MNISGSYGYKANVKDKVKRLEAKAGNVPVQAPVHNSATSKSKMGPNTNNLSDKVEPSSPAVMDVEITQLNSPRLPATLPEVSVNEMDSDSETEMEPPVSVKSLLRRFSSGMTHTFRKKTTIDNENEERVDTGLKTVSNSLTVPGGDSVVDLDDSTEKTPSEEIGIQRSKSVSHRHKPTILTNKFKTKSIPDLASTTTANDITANVSVQKSKPESTGQLILNKSTSVEGSQSSFALSKLLHFQRSSKAQPQSQNNKEENISESTKNQINSIVETDDLTNKNNQVILNNTHFQTIPKPKPRVKPIPDVTNNAQDLGNSITIHTDIVVVVGPHRAGKSSVVNYLLHQDLSTVYKSRPSQREIVECITRTKTGPDDILSLVLIDSPGFINDKLDAAMWATLTSHLDSSSPLDLKPPSLILAVVQVDDSGNLIESEALSNFCKVLSYYYLNAFSSLSKILFVVTHSTPLDISNGRLAIERLSNLTKQYFPIKVCFHRIVRNNDTNSQSVTTPAYPDLLTDLRSLFDVKDMGDNNHRSVIKYMFSPHYPKTLSECFVSKRIPLKSTEHPDTLKTSKIFQNLYQNVVIEQTEIATLLEIGWENVDNKLRKMYPSSVLTLQQIMQRCQIKNFSDLPEDPIKVFELLKHIPQHNPAITDLLTETLQLKIPSCFSALYIGQGYDVSKDAVTHVTPFQLSGALKTSPVGLIPDEISCKLTEEREIIFKFYCTPEEYALDRFKDLDIKHVTFPKSGPSVVLTSNQRNGYNIVKPNQEPTKTTIATSSVEYRTFQLSLSRGEEIEFKQQFWDTVSSLPELDIKNPETIDCWSEFFKYWGTHIVKAAYGGGSIQVSFRGKILAQIFKSLYQKSEILTDELETSRVFQWLTGDGLDFARPQNAKTEFMQGCDVDSSFHGGDTRFQQIDLTKLGHDKVSLTREEWIQSLPINPIILETNLVLVPISYFVREKSEGIATKMDVAFFHFYSNFVASHNKESACHIL